jgi:hypothetical protein
MHGVPSASNAVKMIDEATGQTEVVELGPAQDATRRPLWRAFAVALRAHMKSLNLEDTLVWGQGLDDVPDKALIPVLAEAAPDVPWACAGHYRAPDATFRIAARAYGVDITPTSFQGWKCPYTHLLMPRTAGSVICVEGVSTPFTWRMMCDRAIYCGFNGIGRIGADYFNKTWFDGFKGGFWGMVGRPCVQTLWAGENGTETSVRLEAMLEGLQEAEARIYLEQALDRKVLPDDLAGEVQVALDDHFRSTLHISSGTIDPQTMDLTNNWQARSRRLYQTAAKVAGKIGLDVERTSFGESTLTYLAAGQTQALSGGKVTVPALGRTRLALKLRNWSDRHRAWKANASEPWIVPEKGEGDLVGQQELGIVLDGRTLKSGSTVTGTLHLTDVAAGTNYPVKIVASVGKTIELQMGQDIFFYTGGGSGTEQKRLIHCVVDPVLNVPVGGSDTKEYTLISYSSDKLSWKIETDRDWLSAEPATGELAPGESLRVKITARPPDKDGAFYEPLLTLTAAGGAVKEEHRLKVGIIPAYQRPAIPQGQTVYLNELDQGKFMVDHVDAGFSKRSNDTRPWSIAAVPMPYYSRHIRTAEPFPAGLKREEYATHPYQLGSKTFTRGLWVSPTHETRYAIDGAGFNAFAAEVGFYDKLAKEPLANLGSVVNFEIYVDGKLRAQSGLMKLGDEPRLLVVDNLLNAKEVKLVTRRDDCVNDTYTVVTWGDPRFIKK